jgi:hypothetical protein
VLVPFVTCLIGSLLIGLGEIGRFGKIELSDVAAFAVLPDGKVCMFNYLNFQHLQSLELFQ